MLWHVMASFWVCLFTSCYTIEDSSQYPYLHGASWDAKIQFSRTDIISQAILVIWCLHCLVFQREASMWIASLSDLTILTYVTYIEGESNLHIVCTLFSVYSWYRQFSISISKAGFPMNNSPGSDPNGKPPKYAHNCTG